jgi:hypothetical protein
VRRRRLPEPRPELTEAQAAIRAAFVSGFKLTDGRTLAARESVRMLGVFDFLVRERGLAYAISEVTDRPYSWAW